MPKITVLAGDFKAGPWSHFWKGQFLMKSNGKLFRQYVPMTEVVGIEVASGNGTVSYGNIIGLGLIGDLMFGPIGAVAGAIIGSKNRRVTFAVKFKDGRKFAATTSARIFARIQAGMLVHQTVYGPT